MLDPKSFLVIAFIIVLQSGAKAGKHIHLQKFTMCDPDYDYPIRFEASVRTRDEIQYVNITAIITTPFGQNQGMNATFEYSPTGEGYVNLFKFSRSNFCDFLNKDLGPFWFELQRQIAVRSRSCPVPVGRYNVRNYQLPFSKLSLPLPSGFVRSTIYIVENKTNRIISCILNFIEITN